MSTSSLLLERALTSLSSFDPEAADELSLRAQDPELNSEALGKMASEELARFDQKLAEHLISTCSPEPKP